MLCYTAFEYPFKMDNQQGSSAYIENYTQCYVPALGEADLGENVYATSLQLCPDLWDPIDCSLPGSSVHGILQARQLEWVAMPSSRGSS